VTPEELRERIITIIVGACQRGPNPRAVSREDAGAMLDDLVASDDSEFYAAVQGGEAVLRKIVAQYRTRTGRTSVNA
jgi:hypothetical protein